MWSLVHNLTVVCMSRSFLGFIHFYLENLDLIITIMDYEWGTKRQLGYKWYCLHLPITDKMTAFAIPKAIWLDRTTGHIKIDNVEYKLVEKNGWMPINILYNELEIPNVSSMTLETNVTIHPPTYKIDSDTKSDPFGKMMNIFLGNGTIFFEYNRDRYMVCVHVDGKIDKNALERAQLKKFKTPTTICHKPDSLESQPYLWASGNPRHHKYTWIWFNHCEGTGWSQITDAIYLLCIKLSPSILEIHTAKQLQSFEDEYGENEVNYCGVDSFSHINWEKVGAKYDGLSIITYIDTMRNHKWYNSWDCGSIVLWKPQDTITAICELTMPQKCLMYKEFS